MMSRSITDKKNNIFLRIFVVGCARSGTTLLQSLLAAHPRIYSFTESHFFSRSDPTNVGGGLKFPSRRGRKALVRFLKEETGWVEMLKYVPDIFSNFESYAKAFVDIVDKVTLENKNDIWLEKTPLHLHYVDIIEKYVPKARFIHIVRNGLDNIASLYKVSHDYPDIWEGGRTLDQCVDRWVEDVSISMKYKSSRNHKIIRYENLVANTDKVLEETCDFLGIKYSKDMILNHKKAAQKVILPPHHWVRGAISNVKNKPIGESASRSLTKEQRRTVQSRIDQMERKIDETFSIVG